MHACLSSLLVPLPCCRLGFVHTQVPVAACPSIHPIVHSLLSILPCPLAPCPCLQYPARAIVPCVSVIVSVTPSPSLSTVTAHHHHRSSLSSRIKPSSSITKFPGAVHHDRHAVIIVFVVLSFFLSSQPLIVSSSHCLISVLSCSIVFSPGPSIIAAFARACSRLWRRACLSVCA